ncbi:MAG: thermonuclease family protein [Alphaproteobacteria bacterium]|nr:thermonuclease family protein [Alphaproteobacteria bacterium]
MKRILFCLGLITLLAAAPATAAVDRLAGPLSGEVMRVVDGDTITVRLKIWIGQSIETHVRIDGIDAPEIKGKCTSERARAEEARKELVRLLHDGKVELTNIRNEKYAGRVLASVRTSGGVDITQYMIEHDYARPYKGAKRKTWCTS